ncbi:CAMK family protein kinase [Tritrichomonas foetus]|uniref:CAMK family protein kinase n=1 Tax=Tritrichomonas foetus TaxID=1144522 RepID=A0A1J4K8A3_9EUKA|nr:CAMK family protein kinase [Tritrichomonas foetus]|eukprot:OHT07202.1 CAMK family protein kinase [Tritrichomonas foetus]
MIQNSPDNNIHFLKQIGKGAFATVWQAIHPKTGTILAVKVFDKSNISNSHVRLEKVKKEIEIMKEIEHPLVCTFFGDFENSDKIYICQEFISNGTLLDYINEKGKLEEIEIRRLFCELLVTIDYLHSNLNLVHHDLKAENILLDENFNIRVIDFGFSCKDNIESFLDENPKSLMKNDSQKNPENNANQTKCGTICYVPPEIFLSENLQQFANSHKKYDIWSMGVILYTMATGFLPFDGQNDIEIAEKIVYIEPEYPKSLNPKLVDLIKSMLRKNQLRRITLNEIKKHPWISQTELTFISRLTPTNSTLKYHNFDKDVLLQMSSMDYDVSKLEDQQKHQKFPEEELFVYRILDSQKKSTFIKNVIEGKIANSQLNQGNYHRRHTTNFPLEEEILTPTLRKREFSAPNFQTSQKHRIDQRKYHRVRISSRKNLKLCSLKNKLTNSSSILPSAFG